jgi:hypothetical protein
MTRINAGIDFQHQTKRLYTRGNGLIRLGYPRGIVARLEDSYESRKVPALHSTQPTADATDSGRYNEKYVRGIVAATLPLIMIETGEAFVPGAGADG